MIFSADHFRTNSFAFKATKKRHLMAIVSFELGKFKCWLDALQYLQCTIAAVWTWIQKLLLKPWDYKINIINFPLTNHELTIYKPAINHRWTIISHLFWRVGPLENGEVSPWQQVQNSRGTRFGRLVSTLLRSDERRYHPSADFAAEQGRRQRSLDQEEEGET